MTASVVSRSRRRTGWSAFAGTAFSAIALIGLLGVGQPMAVSAVSPSPDPCDVTPASCATVTAIVTGNGEGSITSIDGFITCQRSGGTTTGSCFHRYDVSGGPVPFGVEYLPASGSVICTGPDSCSPVGAGQGELLDPGDVRTYQAEFRLLATPVPTVAPSATARPTPRPTRKPIPTHSPVQASPTEALPSDDATDSPPVEPTETAPPPAQSSSSASPLGSPTSTDPVASTDVAPSIVVALLGALLIAALAFAAGYATALRRQRG
jgi:hypothetical protein